MGSRQVELRESLGNPNISSNTTHRLIAQEKRNRPSKSMERSERRRERQMKVFVAEQQRKADKLLTNLDQLCDQYSADEIVSIVSHASLPAQREFTTIVTPHIVDIVDLIS